jgi:type VI secretion system protein ImpC
MSESIQKKLLRVRPPRVRITYDVHTNGAIEKRELPFVVGIFADLSGDIDPNPTDPKMKLPEYKDRKIVDIDRDNFNEVLKQSVPRVNLAEIDDVVTQPQPGGMPPKLRGALVFASMDDFEPIRIVDQVPVLKDIFGQRKLLRDAQAKAEVDDTTAKKLEEAIALMEETYRADPALSAPLAAAATAALKVLGDALTAVENAEAAGASAESISKASDGIRNAAHQLRQAADAAKAAVTAQDALAVGDKGRAEDAELAKVRAVSTDLDALAKVAKAAVATLVDPTSKVESTTADALAASKTALTTKVSGLSTALPTFPAAPPAPAAGATGAATGAAPAAATPTLRETVAAKLNEAFPGMTSFATDVAAAFATHVFPIVTVPSHGVGIGRGAALSIDLAVEAIDKSLSKQLSAIMHSKGFQAMEATWRGLFHLVSNAETGTRLKLRVLNATLKELRDDMSKAVEFDQSKLFKLIYEAEYGSLGGSPYSMLLGDYEIGPSAPDMTFLAKMSGVAAAAHAPFLAAAAPAMFGLTSFGDLARPRDLAKIFEGADLTAWSEFRGTEDSRYVSLMLPHVLLRLPYGEKLLPADGFRFEESVLADNGVPDNRNFLWGNAAYFLAERITNAFSLYSWTAAIRGVEGGGLVENLPIYTFSSSDGDDGIKEILCPTEVAITDRREKEINDLGFIALCHSKGSGKAVFFGGQTTNRPKKYINADANANAALSSRLPYIMAASRFAHYIKVIVRDKIGGFLTRGNVEAFLNNWISQYVLIDDSATQEVKSAFPLREASIVVVDVPGEPGSYKATVFLKPHFQLEELTTSIRLVANLPK